MLDMSMTHICLFDNEVDFGVFHEALNTFYLDLHFMCEEKNGVFSLPDVLVNRTDLRFLISIYRKAIFTILYGR